MLQSGGWGHTGDQRRSEGWPHSVATVAIAAEPRPAFFLKHLRRGARLFGAGDIKKHLYRVESGRLALLGAPKIGAKTSPEDLKPGDVFGLGFYDRHIENAVAVIDSTVTCWPRSALSYLTRHSPSLEQRQFQSFEREIAHVRAALSKSTMNDPPRRLALFLSYISKQNEQEGRDPQIIDESMRCGVVSDYLKVDVNTLSKALVELERNNIIARLPPDRLFIRDLERLEHFASRN